MDDVRNGGVYGALFLFFIVVLIVGGYFLTFYLVGDKPVASNKENISNNETLNTQEEYITFTNVDIKNQDKNIVYQDVNFNFDSSEAKSLANTLNNHNEELKNTYKLISDANLTEEELNELDMAQSEIYEAEYQEYAKYFYDNYATLVVNTLKYSCLDGNIFVNTNAYTFDVTTGKSVSKNDILFKYNYTIDEIKEVIRETLIQNDGDEGKIDIEATLNNIDDANNYGLYINKNGDLVISYLVKNVNNDYNDVIILN